MADEVRRSTQRKAPRGRNDEAALTADIVALANQYGRYGYRRAAALLRGGLAGEPPDQVRGRLLRVERRAMVRHRPKDDGARGARGPKVPRRPPERGRLWLAAGLSTPTEI
jgi:hypothetical protein